MILRFVILACITILLATHVISNTNIFVYGIRTNQTPVVCLTCRIPFDSKLSMQVITGFISKMPIAFLTVFPVNSLIVVTFVTQMAWFIACVQVLVTVPFITCCTVVAST